MTSSTSGDVWPVLKPMKLPPGAKGDYALWFVESDITGITDDAATSEDKATTRSRLRSWLKNNIPDAGFGSSGHLMVIPIMMDQDDLDQYFAVDEETLEYLPNVREPTGGRLAWLKEKYEEQEPKARKIREVSGMVNQTNAAFAPAGGFMGVPSAMPAIGGPGGGGGGGGM